MFPRCTKTAKTSVSGKIVGRVFSIVEIPFSARRGCACPLQEVSPSEMEVLHNTNLFAAVRGIIS